MKAGTLALGVRLRDDRLVKYEWDGERWRCLCKRGCEEVADPSDMREPVLYHSPEERKKKSGKRP